MVLILFLTKQSLSYAGRRGVMRSSNSPTTLFYKNNVCLSNIFITATVLAANMTRYCLKCEASMRTIYPRYGKSRFVQRICRECGWSSRPIRIPDTRRDMTFVQTGNGTVAQRLEELEEQEWKSLLFATIVLTLSGLGSVLCVITMLDVGIRAKLAKNALRGITDGSKKGSCQHEKGSSFCFFAPSHDRTSWHHHLTSLSVHPERHQIKDWSHRRTRININQTSSCSSS